MHDPSLKLACIPRAIHVLDITLLATTSVKRMAILTAPPRLTRTVRQEQPSGLADGRADLSFRRRKVPAGMFTIPAKRLRHGTFKVLLATSRPLRRGDCTDVYFNHIRSARSV